MDVLLAVIMRGLIVDMKMNTSLSNKNSRAVANLFPAEIALKKGSILSQ